MKRWVVISISSVLAVGVVVMGVLYWQEVGKLNEANIQIAGLETQLAAEKTKVTTLEADLTKANTELTNLKATNTSLNTELTKVKAPRHWNSLAELTDWLQKDDTNTRYASKNPAEKAFILQVRALRDGYLLPATVFSEGTQSIGFNQAMMGNQIYWVDPVDDTVLFISVFSPVLPSHPLPLE